MNGKKMKTPELNMTQEEYKVLGGLLGKELYLTVYTRPYNVRDIDDESEGEGHVPGGKDKHRIILHSLLGYELEGGYCLTGVIQKEYFSEGIVWKVMTPLSIICCLKRPRGNIVWSLGLGETELKKLIKTGVRAELEDLIKNSEKIL